ncbi:MAG TPA: hypothetical protein VEI05_06205, partial [Burkholderiaceae bacterium]|nr:hypothetical protein [Burkholderiaceae bacterium]
LFGLRSVATTLEALPGLWGYLTKEWLRLVVPNTGDENRARWPLHPFWGQLQLIPWEGTRLRVKRIPKQASIPSDKYIARAALALVSTEMAVAGVTDPDDAWASVKAKLDHHLTKQEQWEGADRDRLLQERALLKERKYGTNLLAKKLGQISGIAPTREPGEEG